MRSRRTKQCSRSPPKRIAGWRGIQARGGLSGTCDSTGAIRTKGSAHTDCVSAAAAITGTLPMMATEWQQAAQILHLWDASRSGCAESAFFSPWCSEAVWPSAEEWLCAEWSCCAAEVCACVVIACWAACAGACCAAMPHNSMLAAANPCKGTVAIKSQAKKKRNRSMVA